MKTKRQKIGWFGEDFTANYLKKQHYHILERNFHSRFGEIDLIVQRHEIIAFVEVKTRTRGALYSPREAVDFYKMRKCIKTAEYYLLLHPGNWQPRFDVSEILLDERDDKRQTVVEHRYLENAFGEV